MKLNSLGPQIWIKTMGGSGNDPTRGISGDSNGNIYLVGVYANDSSNGNAVKDFAGNTLL